MKLRKVKAVLKVSTAMYFGGEAGQQQKADDGVVDAEFTEVKDDKK